MRSLDGAVGAPLISALALVRPKRALPAQPARIAILQPTAIGDAILSSGVIAHVVNAYPHARVVVFHGPSNASAMALIDAAFEKQTVPFGRPWKALAALRAFKPDLVIDLAPWPRATALAAMLSGGVTVGFDSEDQARGGAFDVPVAHSCGRHEFENFAGMAQALGLAEPYRMTLKTAWPAPALELRGLVLCHAQAGGSRAADRAWPDGHWVALARLARAKGYKVAFTGAPADKAAIDPIVALAGDPGVFSLAGKQTIPELAGLIQHAAGLVSVDTGVLHLGAALGGPVVGLHGPSASRRWGAWSARARGVDSPYPGSGFTKFGFEPAAEGPQMMAAISPDTVWAALEDAMAGAQAVPELAPEAPPR